MRSLLDIKSLHEFTSRLIDFVPDFPQSYLDFDVLMGISLVFFS